MEPILIIDAGHGGNDPGGGSNQYWFEKDMTLKISLYQYKRFKELGIPVTLTRDDDRYLNSTARTMLVRDSDAKYCISNHINAGGGEGAEVIHSIYNDGKLANTILNALTEAGQKVRRVFYKESTKIKGKDYYFMHRKTGSTTTVITEYGFADNPNDTKRLLNHWQEYAEAVVKAFCYHIGHIYIPPYKNTDLEVLASHGIISSPEYWIQNAIPGKTCNGEYVSILIQNMAKKLRGE